MMWLVWLVLAAAPPESRQQIVVRRVLGEPVHAATVAVEERSASGRWRVVLGPFPATVGAAGFAPPGDKREGDGRTPSGVFPISLVFGREARPPRGVRMSYRQATAADVWVDDPASPDYNRWVRGRPNASSWETLRRSDDLYRLVGVIDYNAAPIVPGLGSAIFLHVWTGPGESTVGCVSLAERPLRRVLARLRPELAPRVVLNPTRAVPAP